MSPVGTPDGPDGERPPRVVAVSGSRRAGSYTRRALVEVLSAVDAAGGDGELLDLSQVDLPGLDPSEGPGGPAEVVTGRIRAADAVVLGTPTYHGSYSGVLKNALDHCGFDEFDDTTVGLLAVGGGPFPATALDHLRDVCRALHAWVLPYQVAIPHGERTFDGDGPPLPELTERLATLGEELVRYAHIRPTPTRTAADPRP